MKARDELQRALNNANRSAEWMVESDESGTDHQITDSYGNLVAIFARRRDAELAATAQTLLPTLLAEHKKKLTAVTEAEYAAIQARKETAAANKIIQDLVDILRTSRPAEKRIIEAGKLLDEHGYSI